MKNWTQIIIIFLVSLFFYILTLRGVFGNVKGNMILNNLNKATKPFELSPERGRFILTLSLAENKSFSLTQDLAEAASPDVGEYKEKYYIYFAPGISLMALPFYLIGRDYNLNQVFVYCVISLFSALNIVFIFLLVKNIFKLSFWKSLISAIIFGFGSTSWSYAITLYQHQVTTFLLLSGFYAAFYYRRNKSLLSALYVWIACAWGIWIDYPNFLLLAPVMIYFIFNSFSINQDKKKLNIFVNLTVFFSSIVFILLIILHGYLNYVNYGDWKKLSNSLPFYVKLADRGKITSGLKKLEGQSKNVSGFFREESAPGGFSILLFSRDRGLLLYSPIFALALLGIYSIRKKITLEIGILLALVCVNLLVYSSWGDPWGGWAYGPRYLIPSMAILSVFVGLWLHNVKYKLLSRVVTFTLFAYSCFIALLGALTTNQVPPKVEADFLKMKYNFLLNWDYFMDGKSGSFVFNEFASKYMNLQQYFALIYIPLLLIVFSLLFIVPSVNKNKNSA